MWIKAIFRYEIRKMVIEYADKSSLQVRDEEDGHGVCG
jgi:hypothetical protein